MAFLFQAIAIFLLVLPLVQSVPTIEVKGSKFFTSLGDQWFIKGIAYQLVPDDPLIDTEQCTRDANLMKTLDANAIRVYHVDPAADHSGCMKVFGDAGIYLFVDLDTFDTQIEQVDPHWNETQFLAFQKVMDAFHMFDNVAGFFVGNEVLTTPEGSPAAPFVKAASRDMKAYRNSKKYRNIPIGYSAADISSLRPMLQNYLACGEQFAALDFFSLNAYEWCGPNTFKTSGYAELTKNVTSYNIPIFFSETGCITSRPRTFKDQTAIFGPDMAPYWSGSIVYEWIQELNDYGLISYGPPVDPSAPNAPPDGFPRSGNPIPVKPDFENLKKQWKGVNPEGVKKSEYTPTLSPVPCPKRTPGTWEVDPKAPLPPSPGKFVVPQDGDSAGAAAGADPTPSGGASPMPGAAGGSLLASLLGAFLALV